MSTDIEHPVHVEHDQEIAVEARALFAKKIEQLMRRPESKPPGA